MAHSHNHDIEVPKPALIAIGAMLLTVTIATGLSQLTGLGQAAAPTYERAAMLRLRFEDEADGAIGVFDGETGARLHAYDFESSHFVRTTVRALIESRRRVGIGGKPPFMLVKTNTGALVLEDPTTGKSVVLPAFSEGNADDFDVLFVAAGVET
ncbi:MAG: photosynthetic complex assembly protein PuhC [Pseudomonadota bacterium]